MAGFEAEKHPPDSVEFTALKNRDQGSVLWLSAIFDE